LCSSGASLPWVLQKSRGQVQTHTHTHTHTHARTHTHTRARTRAHVHTRTRARAHTHTDRQTDRHTHTHLTRSLTHSFAWRLALVLRYRVATVAQPQRCRTDLVRLFGRFQNCRWDVWWGHQGCEHCTIDYITTRVSMLATHTLRSLALQIIS
jgi:hypothetical protein